MCLVVDECHKATGKADIVTAIQAMQERRCRFRVLGLSATPGGKRESVQVSAPPPPTCSGQQVMGHVHAAALQCWLQASHPGVTSDWKAED